ncbi:Hypothetical predicted protein [Podarcis lilfordi]|uniref:Uncharacterized protein n=1 Tax=Podarcis lilfordi TaxID=74358 RepID=A0AA35L835_9SAUR|nr:Hypothetical predicted protein [Podarcis lilfordi]
MPNFTLLTAMGLARIYVRGGRLCVGGQNPLHEREMTPIPTLVLCMRVSCFACFCRVSSGGFCILDISTWKACSVNSNCRISYLRSKFSNSEHGNDVEVFIWGHSALKE